MQQSNGYSEAWVVFLWGIVPLWPVYSWDQTLLEADCFQPLPARQSARPQPEGYSAC